MAQKFAVGGETARNAFFETIQGLKQMDDAVAQDAAGVALFGTMWEDLGKDVVLNMDKMGGAFDKNKQTMLEINKIKYSSFSKAVTGIGRQLSVAFIDIGERILPYLNQLANWLNVKLPQAVKIFSNSINIDAIVNHIKNVFHILSSVFSFLKNHLQEVKAVVVGLAAAFIALKTTTVAGKALKAINKEGNITKLVMNTLKKSLLANPFILVAAAIGVLVGAIVFLYQKSETFRTKVQELWSRLKEFATVIGSSIIGALQQLHSWFSEKIIPSLSQIGQSFMELCQTPFVSWITDVFVSGIGIAFQNFFTVIGAILPHIQALIEGLLTAFNGILTFLNGVFAGDWSKAWQGVKEIFSGIWQSIKSIFLGVIEVIKGRINGITSQINNVAQKMSNVPLIGGLAQKINIPQFATGTQYFKGGTALVGEYGAEIVNMPSGSKVTPADKTKQLLKSGNAVNVYITVQGNVIGNEQYANQLGSIIVQKVLAAQGNI